MTRFQVLNVAGGFLSLTLLMISSPYVEATSINVVVDSHDGPWDFTAGGLNTAYQFGGDSYSHPVVISGADGFSFAAGGSFTIQYLSGSTSAGLEDGFPLVDAKGDTNYLVNNQSIAGAIYPSFYFNSSDYPAYISELVGTFANSAGAIIGTPFNIGDLKTVIVPTGATLLELGINDNYYFDDSGSLTVNVVGPSAVPEPSGIILLGLGLFIAMLAKGRRGMGG